MKKDSPLRRHRLRLAFVAAIAITSSVASAQEQAPTTQPTTQPSAGAPSITTLPPSRAPAQGVVVLGMNGARDDAFALARSVYASTLRPRSLDELRARIAGGDPAPLSTSKDIKELAELRSAVNGEDAASRRLLAAIAQQLNVQAILVVSRVPKASPAADAGSASTETDGGAPAPAAPSSTTGPVARLFLAETGDFDAARYEPDETGSWGGTATSLSPRFPPPAQVPGAERKGPPPKLVTDGTKENKPFYTSPWLWAAVGAAALVGTFFFFASQDNSDDPIHLQMHVPR